MVNAEQIKKALMYCTEFAPLRCDECPMEAPNTTSKGSLSCSDNLMKNALSLITSQEQRVKELTEKNERLRADTVRKMQSEIKERCIKGGIFPVLVERIIDQVANEIIEGRL